MMNIVEYNTNTETVPDLILYGAKQRQLRNELLAVVDRVNPIWYNTLSYDQQEQLIEYRRNLLNVPQQAGFPNAIEWPQKPSWL